MEFETQTRTQQILTVMKILAWVAFVGYAIEGGSILISYVVSFVNPDAAKNLYEGLNLHDLREFNFWHYTMTVSFIVALTTLKCMVAFMVIRILSKMNLANPFKLETAKMLEKISYYLFSMWVIAMTSSAHTAWVIEVAGTKFGSFSSGESIFMAGLVFIVSQVFKRGVEIQSENDLTV